MCLQDEEKGGSLVSQSSMLSFAQGRHPFRTPDASEVKQLLCFRADVSCFIYFRRYHKYGAVDCGRETLALSSTNSLACDACRKERMS